jgi:hypothetical protein
MFLQLPKEIQEVIYDKLHVRDRVMLNVALPKEARIKRTIRTDKLRDKQIGMTWHYIMKRKPARLSASMRMFLETHKQDPTVQELIMQNKSAAPTAISAHDAAFDLLDDDLNKNSIQFDQLHRYPTAWSLTYMQKCHLCNHIAYRITVPTMQAMIANEQTLQLLRGIIRGVENLFFNLINVRNEPVLEYILRHQIELEITDAQKRYVTRAETIAILCQPKQLAITFKHFDVPPSVKIQALERMMERCAFEGVEYMMSVQGVSF